MSPRESVGSALQEKLALFLLFRRIVNARCKLCSYQARSKQAKDLNEHIQRVHEGIRYPCDLCDYQATKRGHLKTHKESKHEGKRYPCPYCTQTATQKLNLKTHIKKKHNMEGVHEKNNCFYTRKHVFFECSLPDCLQRLFARHATQHGL